MAVLPRATPSNTGKEAKFVAAHVDGRPHSCFKHPAAEGDRKGVLGARHRARSSRTARCPSILGNHFPGNVFVGVAGDLRATRATPPDCAFLIRGMLRAPTHAFTAVLTCGCGNTYRADVAGIFGMPLAAAGVHGPGQGQGGRLGQRRALARPRGLYGQEGVTNVYLYASNNPSEGDAGQAAVQCRDDHAL